MADLALALALATLSLPASAPAQVSGPAVRQTYIQPGFVFANHPEGTPYHRIDSALGGSAFGFTLAVGRTIARNVSLEGEAVFERPVSREQIFSYLDSREEYTAEHRDSVFSGIFRFHQGAGIDLVCGAGLVWRQTAKRSFVERRYRAVPPAGWQAIPLPDAVSSQLALAVMGGVDARIPASSSVDIVPSLRLRWIEGKDPYLLGLGSYAVNVGVAVRAKF